MICPVCKSIRIHESWRKESDIVHSDLRMLMVGFYCADCGIMLQTDFVRAKKAEEVQANARSDLAVLHSQHHS